MKYILMLQFSRNVLVHSIYIIIFYGVSKQPVFAESVTLPTLTVKAENLDTTDSQSKFASSTRLGALGDKKIVDTPFSVTRYTHQMMQDIQASTTSEILKSDPSIRETTNSGHMNENIQIRGFSVGYDDYNLNGLFGMSPTGKIPTEILDSITILKGPGALVSGMSPSGSIGGVLMAQTKRADHNLTQVTANYENGGYYKSGFDIARRFGLNNQFGIRMSGSYGQGQHIISGMNDKDSTGLLALDYTTDKVKINFDSYAVRNERDNGSPAMVGLGTIKQIIKAPDGSSNYFKNLHAQQSSRYTGLSGEYKFTSNLKTFANIGYAEKEYSGHVFGTRIVVNNSTTGAATSQYYRVGLHEHDTAGEIGIEGKFNTGIINHTVGLRADYLNKTYSQHYAPTSTSYNTNLYNTDVGSNAQMPTSYPKIGPYGDNTYVSYLLTNQMATLDNRLQLILGARYQDIHSRNLYKGSSYSANKVSPSVGLVVKPFNDNLSFYTSYVEGLSEGVTVNSITYPSATNKGETLPPSQTKQYELGGKYQLGNLLNTLAVFQIEQPTIYQDSTTKVVKNDARTRSRGIEFSSAGNISKNLNIISNLAYIRSNYYKSGTASLVGKTVYGVPNFTAGMTLDYSIPSIEGLSINHRVTYVSEQYLNSANTLKLPDYVIFDLGAKYVVNLGGVPTTFRANIDNISNRKYWAGVFNENYATIGEGRTYKLGITFDF